MRFLFPAGAWGFLSLAAIAALYLLRRRSQSVTVPSLLLWQRAAAEQQAMRPFQKLKKNILFFVQLALAALLTLCLMRPAVSGGVRGETVLIFDLSASMQAEENGESRLDAAKRRADAMLDGMDAGDRVTVLAAGAQAETVLSRSGDLARVRRAIDGLQAGNAGADLAAAVSLAQAMARDIPGLNIVAFSDTYENGDIQVVRTGSAAANRALLSLSVGADGLVFARVANYGPAARLTLECEADGELCDVRAVDLTAEETQAVRMQAPPEARTVRVRIAERDALAADNERWHVARGQTAYRAVLCGDNVFLEKAVALRADIALLRADAAEAAALEDIDLYIFDGALPETLPAQGALLCVGPDQTVLEITPGEASQASGALRAGVGELARTLTQNLLLTEISLRRFTPLTGGETVLRWGDGALLAVTEQDSRRAAVLGFDLHDSNLPMQGDFPVLIQNLLSWLLPDARQALADGVCGQGVTLPPDSRAERVTVTLPSGRREDVSGVWTDTDAQGVYTVTYSYADRPERTVRFALHMDSAESDTRQVGRAAEAGVLGKTVGAGRELTPWVLLAFLALLLAEWEVSRRVA